MFILISQLIVDNFFFFFKKENVMRDDWPRCSQGGNCVYACQDFSTAASGALLVPYVMGQAFQGQYYSSAPTRSDALRVMQNQTVNYWRPCNTVDFYRYCVFLTFFVA
jgi:hypothetical protein